MLGRVPWFAVFAVAWRASLTMGASATFEPIGPTTVRPGEEVVFVVTVSALTLAGFDAADIVIGSHDATDVRFAYSNTWLAAFAFSPSPTPDVGLYPQDVFVGGNNPTPVGRSLVLGFVTVVTASMSEGIYNVRIDPAIGPDVSSLILEGIHEGLQGSGSFTVACAPFDPQCDGDVDLDDYSLFRPCMTGPGTTPSVGCGRFDGDGDADVDFEDLRALLTQFTGSSQD